MTLKNAASAVLVTIGEVRSEHVTQELLERFQPGSVPHYFIIKTIGDHIATNAVKCVPRLKEILARVLPVLGGLKHANLLWVFAAGIGHFCEAILAYCANVKGRPRLTPRRPQYQRHYVQCRAVSRLRSYVRPLVDLRRAEGPACHCSSSRFLWSFLIAGTMCGVLDRSTYDANIAKLLPATLNLYKKEKPDDHLPITTGLFTMLDVGVRGSYSLTSRR